MKLPITVVDAFCSGPFTGNPAAVCILHDEDVSDEVMQKIAMEMNLAETAFVRRRADSDEFDLRWFTPVVEVDLCGHATLASAHALIEAGEVQPECTIAFHTRSGVLTAQRHGESIELDFPVEPVVPEPLPFQPAFLPKPLFTGKNRMDWLVQLESFDDVARIEPDFLEIARLGMRGLIVTAPGYVKYDFVSRFFGPQSGIAEDPATGSSHCALCPFWAERLDKTTMLAYQASKRGGEIEVELRGNRVALRGRGITTLTGTFVA